MRGLSIQLPEKILKLLEAAGVVASGVESWVSSRRSKEIALVHITQVLALIVSRCEEGGRPCGAQKSATA